MKQCLRRYNIVIDAQKPTVVKLPRRAVLYSVMSTDLTKGGGAIEVLMLVRPEEDMMEHAFGTVMEETELGYGYSPSIIHYTEFGYHVTYGGQTEDVGG